MQNLEFYYDFEISKNGLLTALDNIENNTLKVGNATLFNIQMGLASLTLLENAFKGVNFNFEENTVAFVQKLCAELKNIMGQKSYITYCQMLGAYMGWCAVKKYNAYFATVENSFVLVCNDRAYNLTAIIDLCCKESDIQEIFNNMKK